MATEGNVWEYQTAQEAQCFGKWPQNRKDKNSLASNKDLAWMG
jgi:hypothetical protein